MNSRNLTLCAMFTALMAICSWLYIPFPGIPFTMQTFGIALTLLTLGGKRGSAAIAAYLLLGAVGIPVFSGFQGGISAIVGPTGGFLMGFALGALGYWALTALGVKPVPAIIANLAISYLVGCFWYAFRYLSGASSLGAAAMQCVVPFLVPDGIKLALACLLSKKLKGYKKG